MGRRSSITRLDPELKRTLDELLRDGRLTQRQITEHLNALLAERGAETRVSKSAVNRYAMRMESLGAKLRQQREIAEMWIGKLGAQPAGQVGHLLNEFVRGLAFDTAMSLSEGDEPVEPKLLKELSIAVERLERAASEGVRREAEIRKQLAAEAREQLDDLEAEGRRRALDPDEIIQRMRELYGIYEQDVA